MCFGCSGVVMVRTPEWGRGMENDAYVNHLDQDPDPDPDQDLDLDQDPDPDQDLGLDQDPDPDLDQDRHRCFCDRITSVISN